MPRIRTLRLALGWVAWNEDDFGEASFRRHGWTADHARRRCTHALWLVGAE